MAAYRTDPHMGSIKNLYDQFIERFGVEVKPREGNNIRLVCPECKHKALSCNITSGVFYCFHCGYGRGQKLEGLPSGHIEISVDPESHLKVALRILEICTLSSVHKEYLAKRSIYNPEKYGIVSVPFNIDFLLLKEFSKEELIASGFYYDINSEFRASKALSPRRILVPFWQGASIVGLKSRANPYGSPDEPRYICPRGSQIKNRFWYFGELTPADVIITEGELGAISGCSNGYQTIGIPGIGNLNNERLIEELREYTKDCNRVFIILDSDPGYSTDPTKLIPAVKLHESLNNSCILFLPQVNPEQKMDLDQFLSIEDLETLDTLMEDSFIKREEIYLGYKTIIENGNNNRKNKSH